MIEDYNTFELESILKTRQWFYDFLAKSFYMEPELDRLINISNVNIFGLFVDENGTMESDGAKLLSSFFDEVSTMTDQELKSLREEYNTLFIGPGHLEAPPWESVYLSKEGIIFDEHTLSVREFYKEWGVNTKKASKEPDDHIGFQLEFMSILSNKAIEAMKDNNVGKLKDILIGQNEFLDSHTLLWIDEFSKNVVNNSTETFFKGLGIFVFEYLNMDKELLLDLIRNFNTIS